MIATNGEIPLYVTRVLHLVLLSFIIGYWILLHSEDAWRIKAMASLYRGRLDEGQLRGFLDANYDWEKRAQRHLACEKSGKEQIIG